ncbi:hypothetical protein BJ322DRAFT_739869 [Thelephora terrestris]|uniref:F-box domain-containing protein n=1 Tax=Thelephora terrestris TaxID=56493 RepID=A0A9P6HFI8_9AGAM|nr:hypothetical protein BJ322DRAFT_739869 [Thelephora terrestris]
MKQHPGSGLTVPQLIHALKLKLRRTIEHETTSGAVPLIRLENVLELEAMVHSVLLDVRSWVNTFSPVNRLPPEVLSLIPTFLHHKRSRRSLIKWSQVCRYWRNTFTSNPALWTHFGCKDLARTDAFIQRSKLSPIHVRLSPEFSLQSFSALIPHIDRLESLKMEIKASELEKKLIPNLHRPAPLLEHLVVAVEDTTYTDDDLKAPFPLLFKGEFPRLTRLSLEYVSPHPTWFQISNLTTFYLVHTGSHGGSSSQLLDFFGRNPGLEEVFITYHGRFVDNSPSNHIVTLPRLRKLRLGDCPTKPGMLHHLVLPAGVEVALKPYIPGTVIGVATDLVLRAPNQPNFLTGINRISFVEGSQASVHFAGPYGTLLIRASCAVDGYEYDPHDLATRCIYTFKPLDVSGVTELLMENYSPTRRNSFESVQDSGIHHCLRSLPKLRTLILVSCANATHFQALQTPDPNGDGFSIVCPDLKHLFIDASNSRRPEMSFPHFPFLDLLSLAETRASVGIPLDRITVKSAHPLFEDSDLASLLQFVGTVESLSDDRSSPSWDSRGWVS